MHIHSVRKLRNVKVNSKSINNLYTLKIVVKNITHPPKYLVACDLLPIIFVKQQ